MRSATHTSARPEAADEQAQASHDSGKADRSNAGSASPTCQVIERIALSESLAKIGARSFEMSEIAPSRFRTHRCVSESENEPGDQ